MKFLNVISWIFTVVLFFACLIFKSTDWLFVLYITVFFVSLLITVISVARKRAKHTTQTDKRKTTCDSKHFEQNSVNEVSSMKNSVTQKNYKELFVSQTFGGDDYSAVIYTANTKQFYNAIFVGCCAGGGVSHSLHKTGDPISFEQVRMLAAKSSDPRAKIYLSVSEENWQDIIENGNSAVKNNPGVYDCSNKNLNVIIINGSTENAHNVDGNIFIKDNQPYVINNGRLSAADWETVKITAMEQSESTFLWINKINAKNWKDYICEKIPCNCKSDYQTIFLFPNHTQKQKESLYYNELVFNTETDKLYICHHAANGLTGHGAAGNLDFWDSYSEVSLNELCETIQKDKHLMLDAICKSVYAHRIFEFIFVKGNEDEQKNLKSNWEMKIQNVKPKFTINYPDSDSYYNCKNAIFPVNLNSRVAFACQFAGQTERFVEIYIDLLSGKPYYSYQWIDGMGIGMNNYLSAYFQYEITWDEFKKCAKSASDEAYGFFKDINESNWKNYLKSDWGEITVRI